MKPERAMGAATQSDSAGAQGPTGAVGSRSETSTGMTTLDPLQQFVDAATTAQAMFDRDLRYLAYSDRWAQRHGLGAEARGQRPEGALAALGGEGTLRRVLKGDRVRTAGEPGYEVRPWRDDSGEVAGVVVSALDAPAASGSELAQMQALFEGAREADATIWAFDADGRMTLHVGAPLETLGVGQGWNVGELMSDVYADLPVVVENVARVLDGEPTKWTVLLDGRTFESVVTPITDDDGATAGGIGISIDVTDREAARSAAAGHADRLRRLLEATSTEGSFAERADVVLREMTEMLGMGGGLLARIGDGTYTCLAGHARSGDAMAPGDTMDVDDTYCALTLEAGEVVAIEHMAFSEHRDHKCYSAVGLEAYIGAPVYVDGEMYGAISFSSTRPAERPWTDEDVDLVRLAAQWAGGLIERDLRQRELEGSKRRFQGIFNSQYQFQGLLSPDGTLLEANDTAVAFAGVPREELVGKKFWDCHWWLISEETQDQLRAAIDRAAAGEFVRYTVEVQGAGGAVVPIDFSLKPLVNEATGEVVLLIPEGRDVSEMVAAEARLQETVEALAAARDQAESASRAKSSFLASMSHEIRTPMNAVVGFGELLETTDLTDRQRSYVDAMRRASERLLGLIDDILDFSKVEAGRIELQEAPVQLRDLITGVLNETAPEAGTKGLELAFDIAPDVPDPVCADEKRLHQVLSNLVANAVKFTEAGSVDVVVRRGEPPAMGETPPDTSWIEFQVRDTGVGIAEDRLDSIFEAFVQADASTTRTYGGTGLGLALTRRFVELMGGRVRTESTPGEGSRFFVLLPLEHASKRTVVTADPGVLDGVRALVVDDDDDSRALLVRTLERWGVVVSETADPEEALEWIFAGQEFDVGVLDMVMPGLDGLALAERIRERQSPDDLPLVVLSSEDRERHAPDLVSSTVLKPIAPTALHALLRRVVQAQRADVSRREGRPVVGEPLEGEEGPRRPRILLAEDEPDNQALALEMLGQLGLTAEVASDGAEALERLRQAPYDIVLMDVMMPRLDGLEATRRLRRELSPDQQPRVIAMTARALRSDREACLAAGMNGYLAKPVRLADLSEAIQTASEDLPRR